MNFDSFAINENTVNLLAAKKRPSSLCHHLKKLLRRLVVKSKNNTYQGQPQPTFFNDDDLQSEIDDNMANERLENEIFEEIDQCADLAAVKVFGSQGEVNLVPVVRGQRFIPVHFARTEAGTFFWTTMGQVVAPDSDIEYQKSVTTYQKAELQADRWAQA